MVANNPFPSLKAYFELIKAFQRSLISSTGPFFSTFQQPFNLKDFRFATGSSTNPTLSVAVVECITQVQGKLGHGVQPQFCQLLVTDDPYGKHLSFAPRYVQEIFGTYGCQPPALIGGAVEGLLGVSACGRLSGSQEQPFSRRPTRGVSLLAAVLPGVQVYPFHSESTDLPELPWEQLLQVGHPGPQQDHKAAAVVLSEPHFTQVPELLGRLQSAMPGMATVGGVLKHGAWGNEFSRQRSMRGALFVGGEAVDSGAVGCIMTGPLQVDSICAQGCRPVGQPLVVTRVLPDSRHNYILELDNQPAHIALAEAQRTGLRGRDGLLRLQIGVSSEGSGYVQVEPRRGPHGSLDVGLAQVREGSRVQLHVLDPQWAQREMQAQLQTYAGALPREVRGSPASLGALLYSCTAVTHDEASILHTVLESQLPEFAFQGAKVQGEFGQSVPPSTAEFSPRNQDSLLQSYCSSFGFMRRDVPLTWKQ